MIAIRDPNMVPPGGAFVYRHKTSGAEFRHHTVPFLFEQVRKHCEANGYEFTNEEFTRNVCENAHPQVCHEIDATGMPTLVERAANFASAVVRHARHGFANTEQEMYDKRHGICVGCVYYGGESGGTWLAIACRKCGCSGLKLKWANEKCPLGLW